MTLDLVRVVAQIDSLAHNLRAEEKVRYERLHSAMSLLSSYACETEKLRGKIATSKTSWLIAEPQGKLDQSCPPSPCPDDFTVIATDGSQIDVDRHYSVSCYLINIGAVTLHYGGNPYASLESTPFLYFGEESNLADPKGMWKQAIKGDLLGIKRSVDECRHLTELAQSLPLGTPALALLDGSLVLWRLETQGYPDFVKQNLLEEGFLSSLDSLSKLSEQGNLTVASYISSPGSTEVVNILRLALCPYEIANCDRYCSGRDTVRKCEVVAGIRDRDLFQQLLSPGERSALFLTRSKIVRESYREHQILFFYLRLEDEVARVEIPRWVVDNGHLELTHALILDQCHRGEGYPVALSEAHEKAVVSSTDKEQFWHLVELALNHSHLPFTTSAKSQSKRTRWV